MYGVLKSKTCASFHAQEVYTIVDLNMGGTVALRFPIPTFYDRRATDLQLLCWLIGCIHSTARVCYYGVLIFKKMKRTFYSFHHYKHGTYIKQLTLRFKGK